MIVLEEYWKFSLPEHPLLLDRSMPFELPSMASIARPELNLPASIHLTCATGDPHQYGNGGVDARRKGQFNSREKKHVFLVKYSAKKDLIVRSTA